VAAQQVSQRDIPLTNPSGIAALNALVIRQAAMVA
jgi:hypothetical protein